MPVHFFRSFGQVLRGPGQMDDDERKKQTNKTKKQIY